MFGVATSLIRYWEREFDIIKPYKSKKGYRLFTQDDINKFRIIYFLIKEKGMTVQGARDYIRRKKEKDEFEKLEVLSTLRKVKDFLQEVKIMLDKNDDDMF